MLSIVIKSFKKTIKMGSVAVLHWDDDTFSEAALTNIFEQKDEKGEIIPIKEGQHQRAILGRQGRWHSIYS